MPSSPQTIQLRSAFRHPGALRDPENPKQGRLTLVGGRSDQIREHLNRLDMDKGLMEWTHRS